MYDTKSIPSEGCFAGLTRVHTPPYSRAALAMEAFLMVRRKQSTMFLVAREGDTVAEVRRMVAGVCGQQAQDVRLFLQENTEKGDWNSVFCISNFWIC